MKTDSSMLAIHGGSPLRAAPMPPRRAFGKSERAMLHKAVAYFESREEDIGYQGHFEDLYTQAICRSLGGGFADAVATGTAAVFVSLAALGLPKGSEVLVSPIADPGVISAIILNGLVPRLADTEPGGFNMGVREVAERMTSSTRAVLIIHFAGRAAPIDELAEEIHRRGVPIVEDWSQAHGASLKGRPLGTFGDIAALSTMYRKGHMTGGSGGVVYTRDRESYRLARGHADRGKPLWDGRFEDRQGSRYQFPALNLNADELSCAIGLASLRRLPESRLRRLRFVDQAARRIESTSRCCRALAFSKEDSPFFLPIQVRQENLGCTVQEFAHAVRAEGIPLNPRYDFLVCDWPWVQGYLSDDFKCPHARAARDGSFNVYLNENYGAREAEDLAAAIEKVEGHFAVHRGPSPRPRARKPARSARPLSPEPRGADAR